MTKHTTKTNENVVREMEDNISSEGRKLRLRQTDRKIYHDYYYLGGRNGREEYWRTCRWVGGWGGRDVVGVKAVETVTNGHPRGTSQLQATKVGMFVQRQRCTAQHTPKLTYTDAIFTTRTQACVVSAYVLAQRSRCSGLVCTDFSPFFTNTRCSRAVKQRRNTNQ